MNCIDRLWADLLARRWKDRCKEYVIVQKSSSRSVVVCTDVSTRKSFRANITKTGDKIWWADTWYAWKTKEGEIEWISVKRDRRGFSWKALTMLADSSDCSEGSVCRENMQMQCTLRPPSIVPPLRPMTIIFFTTNDMTDVPGTLIAWADPGCQFGVVKAVWGLQTYVVHKDKIFPA